MIHRNNGPIASRLRQRKFQLLRRFAIPADALPGSLSLSHLRCGKPTCHCADDRGHPVWSLTYMVQGEKRVQHIPKELVEEVRRRVEQGHREVVLTGINLGCYRDRAAGYDLPRLVREAGSTPGLARLRLSSIEVNHLSHELAAALHRWLATTLAERLSDTLRAFDGLMG